MSFCAFAQLLTNLFSSQLEISHVLNGTTPKIQHRKWRPISFFAERDENGHRWILQIRNCGPRQAGKYSAVARNRNGTCTRSWHLHLVHPNEITKSPNPNGDESEVNKSQQIESRDQEQPSSKEALKPSAAVVFQKEVRFMVILVVELQVWIEIRQTFAYT